MLFRSRDVPCDSPAWYLSANEKKKQICYTHRSVDRQPVCQYVLELWNTTSKHI